MVLCRIPEMEINPHCASPCAFSPGEQAFVSEERVLRNPSRVMSHFLLNTLSPGRVLEKHIIGQERRKPESLVLGELSQVPLRFTLLRPISLSPLGLPAMVSLLNTDPVWFLTLGLGHSDHALAGP